MSAPHQQGDGMFGLASLTPAELAEITGAALDRVIRPTGTRVTPIPHDWGSPATAGLWRVDVSGESARLPGRMIKRPARFRTPTSSSCCGIPGAGPGWFTSLTRPAGTSSWASSRGGSS